MTRAVRIIIIKYIVTFIILMTYFYEDRIASFEVLQTALPVIRFLAINYIFFQTIAILYRLRNKLSLDKSDNIITGINNGFKIILYVSGFFLVLSFYGVGLVQFFTSISIVAAAIAIVSKDYITSMISGFILSFTKMINIDNYVTIGEVKGQVKDIKLTKMYLENNQGELIILNNDKVFSSDIINHTLSNKRRVSLNFELPASTMYEIDELENALIECIGEFNQYIDQESFTLRVDNIFIDKIVLSFYYTLDKLEPEIEKTIRKKTLRYLIHFIQAETLEAKQKDTQSM